MNLEHLNRDIGQRVRQRRVELDLTTRQLSDLVRSWAPTLYHPRISDIEEGRRDVRAREVVALSLALQVRVTWLLGLPDSNK